MADTRDNALLRSMWCRADIERAAVGMYHRGSSIYAQVIYQMKFARQPQHALATIRHLLQHPHFTNWCRQCNIIVPVPTTQWRRWVRGYNPAALIAGEMAHTCSMPIMEHALRRRKGRRQARSTVEERINLNGLHFTAQPELHSLPQGTHILLVDDVATTGTTLSACAIALKNMRPDIKISVFALAWAGE